MAEAMAAPAVLAVHALSRRFGQLTAVDAVDLEIGRGEVFGFLGPNGAGKSTLLRMLVGLLTPTAGSARVLGFELPRDAERLRPHVGYMTQRFSLYEDLTVEENLSFAGEIFGFHGARRRQRVEETLTVFELAERRDERPATLSGGWRQRLALAAATIHRPEVLVLDEPTAGVDPARRRAFWEEIFSIAADGTTVLVSTHYMDEAVRCHRLCMLIRGRAVAVGEPDTLTAALEHRVLEVEGGRVEEAINVLRALPQVASTTQLGSQVHVLLRRDARGAAAEAPVLGVHLRAAGLGRLEVRPTVPTLEDVFVDLRTAAGSRRTPAVVGA